MPESDDSLHQPARITGLVIAATSCVIAVAAAFVIATEIFLILFLAILFGVFLTKASDWISERISIGYHGCLAIVTVVLLLTGIGSVFLFGVKVNQQLTEAGEHLDGSQQRLNELVQQYPAAKTVVRSTPLLSDLLLSDRSDSEKNSDGNSSESPDSSQKQEAQNGKGDRDRNSRSSSLASGTLSSAANKGVRAIASVFQTTFGLVVNSALIFFVGLFVAIAPTDYRDGVVMLLPKSRRPRTRDVLDQMGESLWHWLIGRFGSMVVTGIGASIVLFIAGVPMALLLGLATGVLTFIPNIGSLIALTLSVLFALPQGASTVYVVVGGYMVLQAVESYVVTPLIQQKQVSLPPALLISFQAIMGVLFGFLGAAVASPLLAAAKTGIEEAYVKDVLGDVESLDQK